MRTENLPPTDPRDDEPYAPDERDDIPDTPPTELPPIPLHEPRPDGEPPRPYVQPVRNFKTAARPSFTRPSERRRCDRRDPAGGPCPASDARNPDRRRLHMRAPSGSRRPSTPMPRGRKHRGRAGGRRLDPKRGERKRRREESPDDAHGPPWSVVVSLVAMSSTGSAGSECSVLAARSARDCALLLPTEFSLPLDVSTVKP